jgi:hypothetical protein
VDEPSELPIEVASSDATEPPPPQPRLSKRFRPGFPWGLASGALLVVLIVAVSMGVNQFLIFQRFGRVTQSAGTPGGRIVVSPVEAGKPWFSVSSAGTGVMQAWSNGGSGSGGDGSPAGTVGEIDIGAIGVVDGVTVRHTLQLYLTATTKVFIGSQAYSKGKSASVADALVNSDGGPGADVLSDRLLTIEFHKVGNAIVADKISAPLEAGTNPLQN